MEFSVAIDEVGVGVKVEPIVDVFIERAKQALVFEGASLDALFRACGPVDHLVVTVGPGAPKQRYASFLEQPVDDARALFENKFWAQYLCARQASPHLRAGGSITLFGGGAARRPVRAMAVLDASKSVP